MATATVITSLGVGSILLTLVCGQAPRQRLFVASHADMRNCGATEFSTTLRPRAVSEAPTAPCDTISSVASEDLPGESGKVWRFGSLTVRCTMSVSLPYRHGSFGVLSAAYLTDVAEGLQLVTAAELIPEHVRRSDPGLYRAMAAAIVFSYFPFFEQALDHAEIGVENVCWARTDERRLMSLHVLVTERHRRCATVSRKLKNLVGPPSEPEERRKWCKMHGGSWILDR